jgi:hypothetical protein
VQRKEGIMSEGVQTDTLEKPGGGNTVLLIVSWLWVGIPLAWGVLETVSKSMDIFR